MNNFTCPNCKSTLVMKKRSLICENTHCFDLAKEGYVNLLLVNSKKSKEPGDNSKMMMARRTFLESGHYEILAKKISEIVSQITNNQDVTILDLGCGEGYYTGYVKKQNSKINIIGLDISKTAIRYASKKYKDIDFCVASAFDIPIGDGQLDMVLKIYAPSSEPELQRVIKKGGFLITVTPGERHLYQLRDIIYKEIQNHSEETKHVENFNHVKKIKLKYTINIQDLETIQNLLEMTPFGWKILEKEKELLYKMDLWNMEIDFIIDIYTCLR